MKSRTWTVVFTKNVGFNTSVCIPHFVRQYKLKANANKAMAEYFEKTGEEAWIVPLDDRTSHKKKSTEAIDYSRVVV